MLKACANIKTKHICKISCLNKQENNFVDLKSNSAPKSKNGHNLLKSFYPQIMSNNSCFPTKRGFTALIAIPHTLGLQAGQLNQGRNNKALKENKILPLLMRGITFHFYKWWIFLSVLIFICRKNMLWINAHIFFYSGSSVRLFLK